MAMLESESRGSYTDFDLSDILATSNSVKSGCIEALMSQYQRMSEATPKLHRSLNIGRGQSYRSAPLSSYFNDSQEGRRCSHCVESVHHDPYELRLTQTSSAASPYSSFHSDQELLLGCGIPDRSKLLSEVDSSSSFDHRRVLRKRKSKVPPLRSSKQACETKYHKLSKLQAFVLC
jgi:hypothetical protein